MKKEKQDILLPKKAAYIIETLMEHGFEAYAVGGCVRDAMLGRVPMDWDITTSAKPNEVKELFLHTIDTGIEHGTVTVMLEQEGFEVTTYRIDGEYEDARHPKEVIFTSNLLEDLKRRDFTINAMAYNDKAGLVDAFGGLKDLQQKVIRCVGKPEERFLEDALRMLRAVRFSAQLGFSIEPNTANAVKKLAPNLEKVSAERIASELVKILISDCPQQIRTAYETGLTAVFFPEFDVMMQTPQNNPHHRGTVGEHTLWALPNIKPDKVKRLTMLLHDVAKPVCRTTDELGIDHFHGHQKEGSIMARSILRRLKFDNDTTDRVCSLILCHDDNPPLDEKSVRKAVFRNGVRQYPALFEIKRADMLAQSNFQRTEKMERLREYKALYDEIIKKKQCLCLKDLAVNGADLIQAGMEPGKEIGEVLKKLLEFVLENPQENTKEKLLEQVHKMIPPHI